MNVSKNFQFSEFAVSAKYPDLAANIALTETDKVKAAWLALTILEPMRKHTGCAWKITSGKRDALLNKVVGGVQSSGHRWRGMTAAIDAEPVVPNVMKQDRLTVEGFDFIRTVLPYSFGELILYLNDDGTVAQIHVTLPTIAEQGQVLIKHRGEYLAYNEETRKLISVKVNA